MTPVAINNSDSDHLVDYTRQKSKSLWATCQSFIDDNVISPDQRSAFRENVERFSKERPLSASLLGTNLAFSAPPLLAYGIYTLLTILTAIGFTVLALAAGLVALVPTLVATCTAATLTWAWAIASLLTTTWLYRLCLRLLGQTKQLARQTRDATLQTRDELAQKGRHAYGQARDVYGDLKRGDTVGAGVGIEVSREGVGFKGGVEAAGRKVGGEGGVFKDTNGQGVKKEGNVYAK